ncbi:MAG: autotransporter-associated beta strand repeat-containing protein, partial [Opitutaceae bacterium]|nr:autotransporter-associated beta strand repeat-containing protein [Opitutaceae bacterium]
MNQRASVNPHLLFNVNRQVVRLIGLSVLAGMGLVVAEAQVTSPISRNAGDTVLLAGWDFGGFSATNTASANARYNGTFSPYNKAGVAASPGESDFGVAYFTGSNGATFASNRQVASSTAPAYEMLDLSFAPNNNELGESTTNQRTILLSSNTVLDSGRATFKISSLTSFNSFDNLFVDYSARNQGSANANISWSYSLDGVNFTSIAGTNDTITPSAAVYKVFSADFSAVSAIEGVSNLWLGLNYTEDSLAASVFIDNVAFYGIARAFATAGLTFWKGGDGVWSKAASPANWLDAVASANPADKWAGDEANFGGTPGTVTVDDAAGAIDVATARFLTSGYKIAGDPLTTKSTGTTVQVGDGSPGGAAFTATIESVIAGSGGLTKTDLGTLVLTGANTYTGGTVISAGTLAVGNGGTSGSIVGNVTNNGVLSFNRSDALSYAGVVSGSGALVKQGGGTLT